MKASNLFTDEELGKIESAIAEAEKKTSGELVALVVGASGQYKWIHWAWAFIGWLVASLVLWILDLSGSWSLPLLEVLEVQVVGALLGTLLSLWQPVRRLTLPRKTAATRVHRECLANFVASGIQETRDRTGVLIYISELEHRVEILADKGIHGICGTGYWEEQVARIVTGLKEKKGCDAIVQAIGQIGDKLAENFPPRADDTNEVDNEVRTEHQALTQSEAADADAAADSVPDSTPDSPEGDPPP